MILGAAMERLDKPAIDMVRRQISERFDGLQEMQAFMDQRLRTLGDRSPRQVLDDADHYDVMKLSVLMTTYPRKSALRAFCTSARASRASSKHPVSQ